MEFRWIPWNIDKVVGHGVSPREAEEVVLDASGPYPQYREDGKLLVWGKARSERLLQVIFVFDEDDTVFIIHARPLTDREKWRYRRARRRKGS